MKNYFDVKTQKHRHTHAHAHAYTHTHTHTKTEADSGGQAPVHTNSRYHKGVREIRISQPVNSLHCYRQGFPPKHMGK